MSFVFFSIYYFLNLKKWFLVFVITFSISLNINFYFDLFKDWNKQKVLISYFENNSQDYTDNIIFVKDYTDNAFNRKFMYYEWNGIINSKKINSVAFQSNINNEKFSELISQKFPEYKNNEIKFISINYEEQERESKLWKRIINKLNSNIYPKFSLNTVNLD